MTKKPVKYYVVDAFADSAFKGNPAAVCFLEDENERDDAWIQSLTAEFNISQTCFLTRIPASDTPCFHLRWFTPVAKVELPSWEYVTELQPRMDDIMKCPGQGIIVTAAGPAGSAYDFCSRFFAPKLGIDEVILASLSGAKAMTLMCRFALRRERTPKILLLLLVLCSFRTLFAEAHIVHWHITGASS